MALNVSLNTETEMVEIEQHDETEDDAPHDHQDEDTSINTHTSQQQDEDPPGNISSTSSQENSEEDDDDDDATTGTTAEVSPSPLSASNRLKKYLNLAILSSLAFASAYESDEDHILTSYFDSDVSIAPPFVNTGKGKIVNASPRGRNYAMVLSGTSAVYHFTIVAIHLFDGTRIFSLPRMRKMFQNGSEIECLLITLSSIWWLVGTWITTSIHGVAGDGKGQFNIYICSWLCLFTNVNMINIWLIAAGYDSVYQAMSTWPNRAPGWIMIFIMTLACMLSILDTYSRYERALVHTNPLYIRLKDIDEAQWVFLITVCAASFITAFGFGLVELFRREDYYIRNIKSSFEVSLEGICLALLVILWVGVCIIATTDGVCSEVGNSYFLTWGSTGVVIQTFINWVRAWRKGVHDVILQQEREYREAQANIEPMNSGMLDEDSDNGEDA